jgi:acyl-coenzyme A synthetase/AMP-(fatty) acid ligase
MNMAHHVERISRNVPQSVAIRFERQSYTYQKLNQLANKMANALHGLGVDQGDYVDILLPNIPQFVIGYHAWCAKARC